MKSSIRKNTILIVEDEPFLVEMYKARFLQEGYNVAVALNGTPVSTIVSKSKPDLILLDIVMPEKDGYAVLQELKAKSATRKIPVLVFSNLGQDEEVKRGIRLGADAYFIKSNYTPTELVKQVQNMISKEKKAVPEKKRPVKSKKTVVKKKYNQKK